MHVTTEKSPARVHLLFRGACLVGALIAVATFLLIWSYRSMEVSDLRARDSAFHSRMAAALIGSQNSPGELDEGTSDADLSYILSRGLLGEREGSASLACPEGSAPIASGGGLAPPRWRLAAGQREAFFEGHDGELGHASSWPASVAGRGECRLEIVTDLSSDMARVAQRSYQIALSSAALEGFLLLALLWVARRGDERLVAAERDQSAMESELFFMAHYDSLTHLPNRSLFWERLDAATLRAGRLGKAVALVLVDLRGFSKLNEEFGRGFGDRVLVEAARRVQSCAHSSHLVCRVGPDEFAVLLEDVEPERAAEAARSLALAIERRFGEPWDDMPPGPRCHCGVALHPRDGAKSEDLVTCAQQAARLAKALGEPLRFHEGR
jgi:diguanylate cyclase (GGDEF)-like protein